LLQQEAEWESSLGNRRDLFTPFLSQSQLLLVIVYFFMVQYLQKDCKIKRDPTVTEDNIIIRVNLIRHIIFRNLQVCLIKYLYQSLLDTKWEQWKWIPQE